MKKIKNVLAVLSAASLIAFGGVSASAATADDVVEAARSAGFLEVYVTQLQNFLLVNHFNSNQYDMMINALSNIESYGDEVSLKYFGKTLAEMRGESEDNSENNDSSSTVSGNSGNLSSDDWAKDIVDKMTNEDILNSLDEIVETGKKLGLDITVEQNGDKSFTMTVKDKDGNVKLVAPIGKIVSTTGVQEQHNGGFETFAVVIAAVMTAGGVGAWLLSLKNQRIGE